MKSKKPSNWRSFMARLRRWSLGIHRELGFLFAGIVCIYALSGIFMNHRQSINPSYSVENYTYSLPADFPDEQAAVGDDDVAALMALTGADEECTHHYFSHGRLKLLLRGGSNITADLSTRQVEYEKLQPRIVIGSMVRLHYNPGRWWTVFSDIFAVALLVVVITGLIIVKGRKGFIGRGGIEFLIGISVPILFLLL